jgi:23S rRNA pseudouridine2605 synthase
MPKANITPGKGERLQKILARAGVASRRAAELMITGGRVRVNGHIVTELGVRADASQDRIELDGQRLQQERPVYIVVHKPRGVVATLHDPEGRPSVGDMLKSLGVRAFPIGRLDFATSGVLLATNDGDFANALLHPRGGVPKRYVLKLSGIMHEEDLDRWRKGVELEDGRTLPAEVELLRHENDKTWIELTIREGRNQQIRRMGIATEFPVMRLARTSFAGISSEGLAPGRWRYMTRQELTELKKTYGVPKRIPHDLPEGGGEGMPSRRDESRRGGYGMGKAGRRTDEEPPEALHDQRRGRAAMPMRTTGKNLYGK